jgi:hypothetical protein
MHTECVEEGGYLLESKQWNAISNELLSVSNALKFEVPN